MGFKELAIATRAATCSNSNYSVAKITEILNTDLCVPIPVKSYLDRDINNVNIPTSCTKIGACAFAGCQFITSISIPATVTTIGENAFNFDLGQDRQSYIYRHIYCNFYKSDISGYPWGAPLKTTTFHFLGLIRNQFTLTAQEAGSTVKLTAKGSPTTSGLLYKTSSDDDFATYTIDTVITLNNVGDYVQFYNTEETLSSSNANYVKFVMTGKIAASGNIQSMLNGSTTCVDYCYYRMFSGCTSLTQAPDLPAITLAYACYNGMFEGCTSLTQAPELPATTLAISCYFSMFRDCTSLTQAPDLPAITLAYYCYDYMFQDCSKLSYISVGFTTWHSNTTSNWVTGVASSGTFRCPSTLPCMRGISYVPEGWSCYGQVVYYYVHQKCESSAITTSITNSETPPSGYEYTGRSYESEAAATEYANSIKGTTCTTPAVWYACVYSSADIDDAYFAFYTNEGSCSNFGNPSATVLECSFSAPTAAEVDAAVNSCFNANSVSAACLCLQQHLTSPSASAASLLLSDTPDDLQ